MDTVQPVCAHLKGLVGLRDRQHLVPVVDPTELAEWAQQPLTVVAVPLQPLLLVIRACQNLLWQCKVGIGTGKKRKRKERREELRCWGHLNRPWVGSCWWVECVRAGHGESPMGGRA